MAVEQTTGTWLPVPEETQEVRRKYGGKVVAIYEVPSYEYEVPPEVQMRSWIIEIAFPEVNFGPQIPMLLSTVIGNVSMAGPVKLLDLRFPRRFIDEFHGPKFGVQGVREILGVHGRPLLNNMIKPCTGFPPEVGAKLLYEAALGGTDVVKDDELLGDAPFNRVEERVRLYMEAVAKAYEETGEQTLYAVNITDRADKLQENASRALEAGANCLMVNYLTAGLSSLRCLAEDPKIDVPILGHFDFAGVWYECPTSGVSSHLPNGKLVRLAGADMVITPSPYGKFPFLRERHLQIAQALTAPLGHIRSAWPMPGGGVNHSVVQGIVDDLGIDCVIAAGGAIHGHPMGPTAGAKALRQAIDAAVSGRPLEDAAKEYEELQVAVDAWGLTGEVVGQRFELKH